MGLGCEGLPPPEDPLDGEGEEPDPPGGACGGPEKACTDAADADRFWICDVMLVGTPTCDPCGAPVQCPDGFQLGDGRAESRLPVPG